MRSKFSFQSLFTLAVLVAMLVFILGSCADKAPKHSLAAQAERGEVLFKEHCASCHGENKDMAIVDTLSVTPPDLTLIKARRGAANFPLVEMARMIDGRNLVKIHGPRAMPVWGEIFAGQGDTEDAIRDKKGELVAYLMSIQK